MSDFEWRAAWCACSMLALAMGCSNRGLHDSGAGGGGAAPPANGSGGQGPVGGAAGGDDVRLDPELEPPVFVQAWGQYGTAPGEFVEPSSVELDGDGNVYVAGHEDRLQKFSAEGALLDIFGSSGTDDGEFDHPHGLAMDRAAGLLYAGDQENGRVQVFTTDGAFVLAWSDPEFQHIHDVGIDPVSGDIYVDDYEADIMQKFTSIGTPLFDFGTTGSAPGEFQGAWGIATDSDGRVYVADTGNQRVQVFSPEGVFLAEWVGFTKPTGVFVDSSDRIYVCDSIADTIVVFDVGGNPLASWDLEAIVGSSSEPEDLIITADGEHIYIGDVLNHRVVHLRRK